MGEEFTFSERMLFYRNRKIDNTFIWILFLFFGWSYGSFGEYTKQFFYYLTFFGFGFWFIYRIFTLNSDINRHNKLLAKSLGFSDSEMIMLGVK